MSGHSKWSKIKRHKGAQDQKRAKIFQKLAREVSVAVRVGGSGDPQFNARLRAAVEAARAAEMPKDSIEAAIRRGLGEDGGTRYEEVVYEAYAPGNIALYIEALTDNRTRTVAELRNLFENRGGSMGSAGCVAWMFKKKGYLVVLKRAAPEEKILEAIVEGGAEDFEDRGDHFEIYTALEDFLPLRETLERSKIPVEYARLVFVPTNTVALSPASNEGRKVQTLIEALEDHDDVQSVWTNADFGDEASVEEDSTAA
ncbi:MAG: YebC/PmpR family DNA-binding transcriptional regulator [Acidobacteriota bacterium]|nr:MAG: YebC/PmpR family DNA-binding transcriptional regulator [Acidobacteriota bacterium]